MLHLFEDLRQSGNLTRFSFTDFQACSIATIVLLLSGILDRDPGYHKQVAVGLDCLRKIAEGNVAATMGVRFVEALQSIANEAVSNLEHAATSGNMLVPAETQQGENQQGANYHGWIEWLSAQKSNPGSRHESPPLQFPPTSTLITSSNDEATWSTNQTNAVFTTWDGAAALQHLSMPPLTHASITAQEPTQVGMPPELYPDFLSTVYNDDHYYLMGLTGLDVLGFSELQE
jgi:hypothetical protein